jgi:hypothetical protein
LLNVTLLFAVAGTVAASAAALDVGVDVVAFDVSVLAASGAAAFFSR